MNVCTHTRKSETINSSRYDLLQGLDPLQNSDLLQGLDLLQRTDVLQGLDPLQWQGFDTLQSSRSDLLLGLDRCKDWIPCKSWPRCRFLYSLQVLVQFALISDGLAKVQSHVCCEEIFHAEPLCLDMRRAQAGFHTSTDSFRMQALDFTHTHTPNARQPWPRRS